MNHDIQGAWHRHLVNGEERALTWVPGVKLKQGLVLAQKALCWQSLSMARAFPAVL